MSAKRTQAIQRALRAMHAILTHEECGDITTQCCEADDARLELAYPAMPCTRYWQLKIIHELAYGWSRRPKRRRCWHTPRYRISSQSELVKTPLINEELGRSERKINFLACLHTANFRNVCCRDCVVCAPTSVEALDGKARASLPDRRDHRRSGRVFPHSAAAEITWAAVTPPRCAPARSGARCNRSPSA
jgi:hypothetical protein